ncbi:MAG: hypothetical protein V1779_02345 [bacterium]
MKKIILLFFALVLFSIPFLSSCTKSNDDITRNFWIKYKRGKPNYLVKFNNDGKFINFNRLEDKFKYQIIQNRLIITKSSGEKQKYFIKVLTSELLKLSEINDIGTMDIDIFKVAGSSDYFLGSWIKINKGDTYRLTLETDGKGVIEEEVNEYIAKKPIKYSVKKNNLIFLNGKEYSYSFSNDIMDLELIGKEGNKVSLTRIK